MPVKWDTEARYRLLIMIIAQQPGILSNKIDAKQIGDLWKAARDEELTPRAVQEQVRLFRKEIKAGNGACPSTPGSGSGNGGGTGPRKPSTPVTPFKRTAVSAAGSPTSSAKKRRTGRNKDSDEETEAELTDEPEAEPLVNVPVMKGKRQLPARSKSRSISYADLSDSDGPDAAAKATDNELDSEFGETQALTKEEEIKGRNALNPVLQKRQVNGHPENGIHCDEYDLEEGKVQEEAGDKETESRRTSWKTASEQI